MISELHRLLPILNNSHSKYYNIKFISHNMSLSQKRLAKEINKFKTSNPKDLSI